MNRRTVLRRMGAATSGIVAVSGAAAATPVDVSELEPGDRVTVEGRQVRVTENAPEGGPVFEDVSSSETLCCCGPGTDPCSILCEAGTTDECQ